MPRNAQLLSVVSLPNILSLLGISNGGGPPGFVYRMPTHTLGSTSCIYTGYLPGASVTTDSAYVGTVISSGLLVNYFELRPLVDTSPYSTEDSVDWAQGILEKLTALDFAIIPMVEYTTPEDLLRAGIVPQMPGVEH